MSVVVVDVNSVNVPQVGSITPGAQWIVLHTAAGVFKIRPEDLVGEIGALVQYLTDLTVSSSVSTNALTYIDAIKTRVTNLEGVINAAADGDAIVNTYTEILAAMASFPEGVSILAEFQNRYTKTEADTKFLTAIKTGGAYYQQNKILLQNGVEIVKIPQMNKVYLFEDSGATSVAMNLAWATANNLHTEDIFIFENRRTTGDVTITADGSQVYFYIDGSDQVITLKPKQAAMLYRWSTNAYLGYSVFLNKETSTGGGAFDANTATIGDITPENDAITDDDTVNVAFAKAQGQIDNKVDKPIDQNMPTTGTITLDFNTETFDNITQTGSITFAGTNTIGSKLIKKTIVVQGSGNPAHTFVFDPAWKGLSGVLPDSSKLNYIEFTLNKGTVFFCVNKYSAVSSTTPTLVTATILQDFLNVIELKYDRLLDGSVALQNSWWSITGKTIIGTQIVNNTVRITVSVAFATTDTAIVSFTNTAGTADGLQDAVGNKCPNFASQNVVLVRYAFDDFNRADSTTSVGTASDGTPWQVITGTWGISGNKMYAVSAVNSGASTVPIILKNAEIDCSIKYTQTWPTGNVATTLSCVLRWQDSSNYLLCQFGRIGGTKQVTAVVVKVLAGVVTTIGASTNVTVQNDGTSHSFICRSRGNQITMIYNGVIYQSVIDLNLPQGNKIGFRVFDGTGSAGNADRIDDITIGL